MSNQDDHDMNIAIAEEQRQVEEDEQHGQAFGYTGISCDCRLTIDGIRENREDVTSFRVTSFDTDDIVMIMQRFGNLAWKLLGRYIKNNTHLKDIGFDNCNLTDEKTVLLFRELVRSVSLERLDMDHNSFGIDGVRSMVPFLHNSPELDEISIARNENLNSECFEVLISALNGTSMEKLCCYDCNIEDISALDRNNLPNLQYLSLSGNDIGRDGCITISNLLQKEDSGLKKLFLFDTDMGNEEAEIIATSLKRNDTLKVLYFGRKITYKGYKAFLKLLIDISSIDSTYTSNHTLTECKLNTYGPVPYLRQKLNIALADNKMSNPGYTKVIKYQLNSQARKEFCDLQGIEYTAGSIFANIEPTLLPKVLSLIGNRYGQSELYTALIPTAPDLLSYIDRKALIKDTLTKVEARGITLKDECAQKVAEYERKIAALKTEMITEASRLTAQKADLSSRLARIDSEDKKQSSNGEGECKEIGSSKKRQRR